MELWIKELRQAVRSLLRKPGYLAGAALVLALGVGANTLVFSVMDSVLWTPLPYRDADRLAVVLEADPDTGRGRQPTSPANFDEWRRESRSFLAMAAAHPWGPVLGGESRPRQVPALRASQSLFRVLGVSPALGRGFSESDGDLRTAVLSHELWVSELGGDPAALGRTIQLDGEPFTVIGVMPPGFEFPPFWATGARLWAPLKAGLESGDGRHSRMLRVFGRLRDGVALGQAQEEMDLIAERLASRHPRENARLTVQVEPLREPVVADFRAAAWLAMGIAACILLIACANTANLTMARAAGMRREMAVRTALGAGRSALMGRLLSESLLVALGGLLLGVPLSLLGLTLIRQSGSSAIPRLAELTFSPAVAAYAVAVSLLAGLLSGIIPAWRHSRIDCAGIAGGRAFQSPEERRTRSLLAVGEVALAIILLSAAGLLAKSFARLLDADPGFAGDRLLTLDVSMAGSTRVSPEAQVRTLEEISSQVSGLPGALSAGFINHLHIGGDLWQMRYLAEGEPEPQPGEAPAASFRVITPGLLKTMGIELTAGREFSSGDRPDSLPVVIVNRTLAALHWPGESPVGKRLRFGSGGEASWATIVGLAGDVAQQSPAREPLPEIYFPYSQNPVAWWLRGTLVVRIETQTSGLGGLIKDTIERIDPDLAVSGARTAGELIGESAGDWRRNAFLAGLFSLVATLLAATGLSGLIHYQVAQEKADTAVRMALGATGRDILGRVVGRGLRLAAAGAAIGGAGALLLGRFLEGFLFRVAPGDPIVLAGVALLMIMVAAAASIVPAVRASRTDPMAVLRHETGG